MGLQTTRKPKWKYFLLRLVPVATIFLSNLAVAITDAPVTTAGSAQACPNTLVTIPVTVTNFNQVCAISLRMDFSGTAMTFQNYSNVPVELTGMLINEVAVNATTRKILVAWADTGPLTFPDDTKLFDLTFLIHEGDAELTFNNTANGGGDCEYADENGDPMNDLPTDSFYINGLITNLGVLPAGSISGVNFLCQGTSGEGYSVAPVPNATSYVWNVPSGVTITSGANTNSIMVDFSPTAVSGNLSVYGTNSCGDGVASPAFPVTVNPLPVPIITGPTSVNAGTSGVIYHTEPNMTDYTWSVSSGGSITSGLGTCSITVTWSDPGIQLVNVNYADLYHCTATTPSTKTVTVNAIPATLDLQNITILSGQTTCYNAFQIITVAGSGSSFTVENGGEVTLIAGQSIHFLSGTVVEPGGFLWGYITTNSQYCLPSGQTNHLVENIPGIDPIRKESAISGSPSGLKIYPNPTSGRFTVEMNPPVSSSFISIEVYSLHGEKVLQEMVFDAHHVVSLEGKPDGIYFIRAISNGQTAIGKIIKQ